MIVGSRVRILLGVPFDILRFVRNLLFPFIKNLSLTLMSGVTAYVLPRSTPWRRGKFFDSHT